MRITEIYPDVISEDLKHEYKAKLNPENPVNWAKTIVGYANGEGGTVFVGVSNDGEAFGLTLAEIDETKNLVSRINDRHIFPHAKLGYMMRSVDADAERFVLAINVSASDSVVRYREGDYNETDYIKGKEYVEEDTLICVRLWKGVNKSGKVIDSARYKGTRSEVFQEALGFVEKNTKSGWRKMENGGRKEIRSYAKETVREALVNAIEYSDYSIAGTQIDIEIYSNRMEIISPGSWMESEGYREYPVELVPLIHILRLYDSLYEMNASEVDFDGLTDQEKVIAILKMEGPKPVKELQDVFDYKSRSQFLKEVINPLIDSDKVYRDGNIKSPTALIKLK